MTPDPNAKVTEMTDLQKLINKLEADGFTDQFKVENGKLHCLTNNKEYLPEDVKAVNFYRFEGPSDPDDMSICYVIETCDGLKGTLIDAYGTYSDDETGEFMQAVEIFKKTKKRDRGNEPVSVVNDLTNQLPKDVLNKEEDEDSLKDPLEQQLEKTARVERENQEKMRQG
jgi:hypothetical protein